MKKWIIVLVVVLVAGVLGMTYWRGLNLQERVMPKRGDVVESIYGLGTVTADKNFNLRTGTPLTVHKVFVREGDLVKVGDPLLSLDGNVMRSPLVGTVTTVAYKEGELVTPQVTALTITNLDQLYLEVSLEQQSILRVQKGQKVFVSFESLRSEKYEGLVASVYPRGSQFIVRIEIPKWPEGVLPGMTADVAILVGKKTDVLLIPLRSIVAGQVTRIRDGHKSRIPIKLGVVDGSWGEVVSDNIAPTDELVVRK